MKPCSPLMNTSCNLCMEVVLKWPSYESLHDGSDCNTVPYVNFPHFGELNSGIIAYGSFQKSEGNMDSMYRNSRRIPLEGILTMAHAFFVILPLAGSPPNLGRALHAGLPSHRRGPPLCNSNLWARDVQGGGNVRRYLPLLLHMHKDYI